MLSSPRVRIHFCATCSPASSTRSPVRARAAARRGRRGAAAAGTTASGRLAGACAARGASPNSCARERALAADRAHRPVAGRLPSATAVGCRVKYGSRNARSSTSTVSDSQTRRSAWFVPNGGSTPHRCTRTPYACAASTAGTMSSSPATRIASVIARCLASASMSARICASTPFCWPRAFRLPSRSFTHGHLRDHPLVDGGHPVPGRVVPVDPQQLAADLARRRAGSAPGSACRRRPGTRAGRRR